MRAKVQKWGNSAAIRIPAAALKSAKLGIDQAVEIEPEDGMLVIRAVDALPAYSLDELVKGITPQNRNIDRAWEAAPPIGREPL